MYPLANDENGHPLEVPTTAAGWLVRRHSGGKGRPGAVYDGDGRPLVVPLDATARDLRLLGCTPGGYRLEPVDANRRSLGLVAYTEVLASSEEGQDGAQEEGESRRDRESLAVEALARAVEAMQRVQAERERAQAERDRIQTALLGKVIDRLAPAPPPQSSPSLRSILDEHVDVQKALRKLTSVGNSSPVASDGSVSVAEETPQQATGWEQAIQLMTPLLTPLAVSALPALLSKIGMSDEQIRIAVNGGLAALNATMGTPNVPPVVSPQESPAPPSSATSSGSTAGSQAQAGATLEEQVTSIFALLTPEERSILRTQIDGAGPATVEKFRATIAAMSPEEAVAWLRSRNMTRQTAAVGPESGPSGTSPPGHC